MSMRLSWAATAAVVGPLLLNPGHAQQVSPDSVNPNNVAKSVMTINVTLPTQGDAGAYGTVSGTITTRDNQVVHVTSSFSCNEDEKDGIFQAEDTRGIVKMSCPVDKTAREVGRSGCGASVQITTTIPNKDFSDAEMTLTGSRICPTPGGGTQILPLGHTIIIKGYDVASQSLALKSPVLGASFVGPVLTYGLK